MRRTATCCCGQLRATVKGEPDRVLACNCRDCQRRTGSVFGASAYFASSQVSVEGEAKTYIRETGDGLRFETSFCPACGSSVLWRSSALPDHVAVAVGCFADPAFPAPGVIAWASEMHGWVRFPEAARTFERSAFEPGAG